MTGLQPQMFCKEQIYVSQFSIHELKRLEKGLLRFSNMYGNAVDRVSLLEYCRDWFAALEEELKQALLKAGAVHLARRI